MDNNEFGNKINPPSQGDYLPPEQEPASMKAFIFSIQALLLWILQPLQSMV